MGGALPSYVVRLLVFTLTFSIILGAICTEVASYTPLFEGSESLSPPTFTAPPNVEYDNVSEAYGWLPDRNTYNISPPNWLYFGMNTLVDIFIYVVYAIVWFFVSVGIFIYMIAYPALLMLSLGITTSPFYFIISIPLLIIDTLSSIMLAIFVRSIVPF